MAIQNVSLAGGSASLRLVTATPGKSSVASLISESCMLGDSADATSTGSAASLESDSGLSGKSADTTSVDLGNR